MSTLTNLPTTSDPQFLRETLGHYASGITIVAGHDGSAPLGFTCQSFYSVSLEPPLVSVSVMRSSTSFPPIRDTGRFSVNMLARDQSHISNQFAKSGTDKWLGVEWESTPTGNPAIVGCLMWLDCTLVAEHEAGDHIIVIGEVVGASPHAAHGREPLLYFRGRYRHISPSAG